MKTITRYKSKRSDNGKWIIGDICNGMGRFYIMPSCFVGGVIFRDENRKTYNIKEDGLEFGGWYKVITETICEYVRDFEDDEGRDCFEGDICTSFINESIVEGHIYYCDTDLRWVLKCKDNQYPLRDIGIHNTGKNIHDDFIIGNELK